MRGVWFDLWGGWVEVMTEVWEGVEWAGVRRGRDD